MDLQKFFSTEDQSVLNLGQYLLSSNTMVERFKPYYFELLQWESAGLIPGGGRGFDQCMGSVIMVKKPARLKDCLADQIQPWY